METPIVMPPVNEEAVPAAPETTYERWPETPGPDSNSETTIQPEIASSSSVKPVPSETDGQAGAPRSAKESAFSIRHYIAALSLVCFALGLTVGVVVGASVTNESPTKISGPDRTPAFIPQSGPDAGQPPPTLNPQGSPDQPPTTPSQDSSAQSSDDQSSARPTPGVLARLNGGAGASQSGIFALPGGQVKVRYQSTGTGLTVRLMQQGGRDGDSFYCPTACSREAAIEKPSGSYYLNIDGKSGAWTVEVAQ